MGGFETLVTSKVVTLSIHIVLWIYIFCSISIYMENKPKHQVLLGIDTDIYAQSQELARARGIKISQFFKDAIATAASAALPAPSSVDALTKERADLIASIGGAPRVGIDARIREINAELAGLERG